MALTKSTKASAYFVIETGVHSIAALDVELDEVDVNVDFAEEVVFTGVLQLAFEYDIDAVFAGVGPNRQGDL